MNTKIIDLKDYFAECIRKIWLIAIIVVLVTGILCIYSYKKDSESMMEMQNLQSKSVDEIEKELSKNQIESMNTYVNYKRIRDERKAYIDNSIYMKLNSYKIPQTTVGIVVRPIQSEYEKDDLNYVSQELFNCLENGEVANYLCANYDDKIEVEYYQELINTEVSDNNIMFSIYFSNIDESKVIADLCVQLLEEKCEELLSDNPPFEMRVYSVASGYDVSDSMRAYQDTIRGAYGAHNNNVNDRYNAFSSEQKVVLSKWEGVNQVNVEDEEYVRTTNKFIVIGIIGGLIVGFAIVFIFYYGSDKIKVAYETERNEGIEHLGSCMSKFRKRFDILADNVFYRKRNALLNDENNLANIISLCEKKSIKEVGILGVEEEEVRCLYIEGLKKHSINAICVTNIDSAINIEKISDVDYVLLFEYLRKTDYSTVEKIIKFCKNRGIDILGYISVVK